MKKYFPWLIFFAISICTSVFSYFFVHFTSDNVMLFTATRFFEAHWFAKGVFPFFMQNMYGGIPFGFDLGLPNFHPFNLLFLIPYPLSYAIFVGVLSWLFLSGFYVLFYYFNSDRGFSSFLTLALFFSGSGFIRLANPTVYAVIAHMGWFTYLLLKIKKGGIQNWLGAIGMGILFTFSGQLPIVLFGYILGVTVCLYDHVPLKKLVIYFSLLFGLLSWYFILSVPLNMNSTRMTGSSQYKSVGNLHPLHPIALLFPYLFGELRSGSRWFMDIPYQTFLPLMPLILACITVWKSNKRFKILLVILLANSLGLLQLPFLRGAVQIYILIHILTFILMAKRKKDILLVMKKLSYRIISFGFVISLFAYLCFQTNIFSTGFLYLYHLVKKTPSLFYDLPTVQAIGRLISHNFLIFLFFFIFIVIAKRFLRYSLILFSLLVIGEGLVFNYLQMYFVPTRILTNKIFLPSGIDTVNYRVQSTSDTIAYTGYFVYQENITLRPPFSKEKTIFTDKEQHTFFLLKQIFQSIPSSWAAVKNTLSVQGYSTFVPKQICQYFHEPSVDWKKEYAYIIEKNPLFGIKVEDLCINNIETSRITMYDPRWAQLGVRYFISDRPLRKYRLIEKEGDRYVYENPVAPSIYRFIDPLSNEENAIPTYIDPNKMEFNITINQLGKKLVIIMNPDGFVAYQNGKNIPATKKDFHIIVPVTKEGKLTVEYSPVFHLQQTITQLVKSR